MAMQAKIAYSVNKNKFQNNEWKNENVDKKQNFGIP